MQARKHGAEARAIFAVFGRDDGHSVRGLHLKNPDAGIIGLMEVS